jgi:hypothetical protein
MAMSSKLLLIAASCVALAACNTAQKQIGQEDPLFGEAVRYNAALQTINPDPIYPEDGMEPGSSGAKGAAAVNRYRTDQVNARHRTEVNAARSGALSTTQGTSGGSGPR